MFNAERLFITLSLFWPPNLKQHTKVDAFSTPSFSANSFFYMCNRPFFPPLDFVIDRPNHPGCASDWLFSLRQGIQSVKYAVEFNTLAAELGWKDLALQSAF